MSVNKETNHVIKGCATSINLLPERLIISIIPDNDNPFWWNSLSVLMYLAESGHSLENVNVNPKNMQNNQKIFIDHFLSRCRNAASIKPKGQIRNAKKYLIVKRLSEYVGSIVSVICFSNKLIIKDQQTAWQQFLYHICLNLLSLHLSNPLTKMHQLILY